MSAPVVIHTPPYDHRHGGIRALHELSVLLRARGVDASLLQGVTPVHNAVHITPEIWPPLHPEGRSFEWLLAPRMIRAHPDVSTLAWEEWMAPDAPMLQVPIVDTDVFHPPTAVQARSGVAYYDGKGRAFLPAAHVPGERAYHITRDWPADRATLADLLRTVRLLVTADTLTAMTGGGR